LSSFIDIGVAFTTTTTTTTTTSTTTTATTTTTTTATAKAFYLRVVFINEHVMLPFNRLKCLIIDF